MAVPTSLWLIMALALAGTYVWRGIGVLAGARIDPNGRLFRWVTCVSYAMLAGLVSRMILMPLGALQEVPLLDRGAAMTLAVVAFLALGRNLNAGVAVGVGSFVMFAVLRGLGW